MTSKRVGWHQKKNKAEKTISQRTLAEGTNQQVTFGKLLFCDDLCHFCVVPCPTEASFPWGQMTPLWWSLWALFLCWTKFLLAVKCFFKTFSKCQQLCICRLAVLSDFLSTFPGTLCNSLVFVRVEFHFAITVHLAALILTAPCCRVSDAIVHRHRRHVNWHHTLFF